MLVVLCSAFYLCLTLLYFSINFGKVVSAFWRNVKTLLHSDCCLIFALKNMRCTSCDETAVFQYKATVMLTPNPIPCHDTA